MNNYNAAKILGLSGRITPALVKQAYRKACKEYHPDRNAGGLEMMKSVNIAYDVLKEFTGSLEHDCASFGDELMTVINTLSDIHDLSLELCGAWLWITGNTKAHKDLLKELSCRWAPKKEKWYFRPSDHKSFNRGTWGMDQIREKHGSQQVKTNGNKKLAA